MQLRAPCHPARDIHMCCMCSTGSLSCLLCCSRPPRSAALQEANKHSGDELPDFYNIVLERPRDDPKGYDVLFIDAAQKLSSGALLSAQVAGCV